MAKTSKGQQTRSKRNPTPKTMALANAAEVAGRTAGQMVGTAMTTVEAFVARVRPERASSRARKRTVARRHARSASR
jgi:hypothetical protein